jgi:hypothetical protein
MLIRRKRQRRLSSLTLTLHDQAHANRSNSSFLQKLNRAHQNSRDGDDQLDSRIRSFELAYRMQMEASDAFDVTKESPRVREMYGSGVHAKQCLMARRLVERGVRFRTTMAWQRPAMG